MLYLLCVGKQVVPCSTCSLCLQVVISALNYIKVEYQHYNCENLLWFCEPVFNTGRL